MFRRQFECLFAGIIIAVCCLEFWLYSKLPLDSAPKIKKDLSRLRALKPPLNSYVDRSILKDSPVAVATPSPIVSEKDSSKERSIERVNPKKEVIRPPQLYVLTTGVREFKKPVNFRVHMVHGKKFENSTGSTFNEGYGVKPKWPIGAKMVADGHVTIWKRIVDECSGWCFVAEDDSIFPRTPPPLMPPDGYVSFFKDAVCLQATAPYSKDFRRVRHRAIRGVCMPYGAVAYALTKSHALFLLSALPMNKPVDHFLWEQSILKKRAFVSRRWVVKHAKGKSLRTVSTSKAPVLAAVPKDVKVRIAVETPLPLQLTCSNFEVETKRPVKTRWTKNTCTPHSFDMAVHSIPDIVSDRIVSSGCWEKDIITQIVQHMGNQRSGHTKLFLDIGANIGAFTSTIASLGHEVIAVEPFKLNVPLIQATVCRHNFNIHLYKVGLADTSPGQKMCIWSTNDKINNGNARMTPYFEGIKDFGADKQKKCMEVIHTYTLDELLFETYKLNRPIDAMKIDIEGFETRAFRGAKKLLASKFKPKKIWFEFQKQATIESGVSATELFQTLVDNGYKIIDFRKSDIPLTLVQWNRIQTGDFVAELQEKQAFTLLQNEGSHKQFDKTSSIIRPMLKKIKLSDLASAKSSDQKGQKCSFPEWIVFAGDSNMRHTYHYWISTIKGYHKQTKSHTFAIDSGGNQQVRWADQETILEFENNCILRASFRFLHGSTSEFIHVFTHWHEFRKYEPFEDQDPNKFNPQNGLVVNKNTVRPSDYALMTTQKGIAIDCQVSNPLLCSKLKQFQNKKPSWVFLTEGWGGVPYCSWFHEATEIMSRYPSINFIWAPIYVTNNNEQRYDCFKRISNNFQPDIDNLKMLDFWDISSKKLPKHTAVGGTHMRTAIKRFSDVWKSSDMPNIENFPKIAVAIPTYNRVGYVQLCADALNKSIDPNDVWIFDDRSTTYSVDDLKKWFHTENVQQNTERQKADKQGRHILEWFITTDYDWLVTLDSDLIVRPDWLELLRGMLPRTQGVVSLYHSSNKNNHPTMDCPGGGLCKMKSLGNAGVVWSKELAKRMLPRMVNQDGFDWGWTNWLETQKITQYAVKDSLVLHVGMHGTWGVDSKREKALGFDMSRLTEGVRQKAETFLKGGRPISIRDEPPRRHSPKDKVDMISFVTGFVALWHNPVCRGTMRDPRYTPKPVDAAIYLSHLSALMELCTLKKKYGLILEGDVKPIGDWPMSLDELARSRPEALLILAPSNRFDGKRFMNGEWMVVQSGDVWGAGANIYNLHRSCPLLPTLKQNIGCVPWDVAVPRLLSYAFATVPWYVYNEGESSHSKEPGQYRLQANMQAAKKMWADLIIA